MWGRSQSRIDSKSKGAVQANPSRANVPEYLTKVNKVGLAGRKHDEAGKAATDRELRPQGRPRNVNRILCGPVDQTQGQLRRVMLIMLQDLRCARPSLRPWKGVRPPKLGQ